MSDILHVFAKPRVKPYIENEALKQAQQRYYQTKCATGNFPLNTSFP